MRGRWAGVMALVTVALVACESHDRRWDPDATDLRGRVVSPPLPKVDFTLMDTRGQPFQFVSETQGFVTLLFFGYTHCPDVCPVHLSNLGAVLRRLEPQVAGRIKVVFVTTDPERDTPERMRTWLDRFSTSFVGLWGTLDEVNRIQQEIGLGAAFREEMPNGDYGMAHAAQILAYTTDDAAHVMYPFGIRQVDWAMDLPKLVLDGPPRVPGD